MLFWASCFLAGISLCCALSVLLAPVQRAGQRAPSTGLPALLRLLWPWVQACALVCHPFISWSSRRALMVRLQIAGFEAALRPEHVVGLQLLALITLSVVSFLINALNGALTTSTVMVTLSLGLLFAWSPRYWLHQCGVKRQREMLREFPFLLDMATLCVEAGLNLQGALQQAARHGPPGPLRYELRHALADMRAGVARLDALEQLADRTGLPAVRYLVTALSQADQLGMSLGPLLRAQSEQRRNERFLRAEKLALEAPVKMLFPMVFCIFPCTFLIIGFPVAVKLFDASL